METFHQRMRAWRDAEGLTQDQAARRLEISISMLKRYESGKNQPGADALAAYQRAGCNVAWLLTGQGEMSPRVAHMSEAEGLINDVTSDPYLRWFLAQEGHWPRQINGLLSALRHMPLPSLREGLSTLAPGWRTLARSAFVDDLSKRVARLEQLADRVARLEAQVNPAPEPQPGPPWAPVF
jgi:transcriptional regulator with XRE-family HTH domain